MTKKTNQPADPKPSASQLWRERLLKQQSATEGVKHTAGKADAQQRNRFANPASGSTARKSRKGLRPG